MPKRLAIPGFLTYADVAAAFSCSPDTVRRMWHSGKLPAPIEVDGLGVRFKEEEIHEALAKMRSGKRLEPPKK